MLPLCTDYGVGVIPWSPLARGRLTRPWGDVTRRAESDRHYWSLYRESDRTIVERVGVVAGARGVSQAQVALAWVADHPVVNAPVVGVTNSRHLTEALAAIELQLTADERRFLEELYYPRSVNYG